MARRTRGDRRSSCCPEESSEGTVGDDQGDGAAVPAPGAELLRRLASGAAAVSTSSRSAAAGEIELVGGKNSARTGTSCSPKTDRQRSHLARGGHEDLASRVVYSLGKRSETQPTAAAPSNRHGPTLEISAVCAAHDAEAAGRHRAAVLTLRARDRREYRDLTRSSTRCCSNLLPYASSDRLVFVSIGVRKLALAIEHRCRSPTSWQESANRACDKLAV